MMLPNSKLAQSVAAVVPADKPKCRQHSFALQNSNNKLTGIYFLTDEIKELWWMLD